MKILLSFFVAIFLTAYHSCSSEEDSDINTPQASAPKKVGRPVIRVSHEDYNLKKKHERVIDTLEHVIDSTDTITTDTIANVSDTINLRILSIGNSFARDAFSYVPFLLQELIPNLNLQLTIMYYPGRPLEDHWKAYQNKTVEYQRDTYTTAQGRWNTEKGKMLNPEVDSLRRWDIIVLQQASGASPKYDTYHPHLYNFLTEIRSKVPMAKLAWLLTPAHPDGYSKMPVATSDEMWEMICDAVGDLMDYNWFDMMFPAGTAIQNARHTSLDDYGDFGHLSAEGLHLQDGIPCLIEAYTITQVLLNQLNLPLSINACTLHPTQAWAESKRIPEMNGKVIEGTDEDYILSKRLALRAIREPYKLYVRE